MSAKAVRSLLRRTYLPLVARRQDHTLYREWKAAIRDDPNPLLRAGAKYFSHFDEDGILLEILPAMGPGHPLPSVTPPPAISSD